VQWHATLQAHTAKDELERDVAGIGRGTDRNMDQNRPARQTALNSLDLYYAASRLHDGPVEVAPLHQQADLLHALGSPPRGGLDAVNRWISGSGSGATRQNQH